jgi:hypothetical protein
MPYRINLDGSSSKTPSIVVDGDRPENERTT